ncbi:tyrosine-protein kinase transmembrane receptor Ror isoform X2 [Culicoides brevitarsis]|uniref:tyrosine-protein kinase transmembrane receptor Ror isoform X2 n=1 Tax=Culicoides brevitarsis TaxID=469753 RepID=UPI00307C6F38
MSKILYYLCFAGCFCYCLAQLPESAVDEHDEDLGIFNAPSEQVTAQPAATTTKKPAQKGRKQQQQFHDENVSLLSQPSLNPLGICQIYTGTTCENYLKNQSVFISPNITIEELEERLRNAWSVIRESRDMNPNCRGYALPSLCFSVLPVCNTPELTNHQYFAKIALYKDKKHRKNNKGTKPTESQDIFDTIAAVNRDKRALGDRHFRNYVQEMDELSDYNLYASQMTTYEAPTRNTENLQRLCKKDCELLELELCSMEYAIAKRHPTIGQKLPLEDCDELREGSTCSHTGIDIEADPHQTCYWDKGTGYRGMVNVSRSGKECMKWTKIMREIADLPELAGHNFCRNPKGQESQPWCYVDKQKTIEYCNITKCAEKMWLYIIAGTLVLALTLFLIVIIICCRKCKKKGVSNIQNINVPNADKNIYGNSRLSSPAVEMASLLNNQEGNTNPSGRPKQNAAILRVPQYRLEDVKFVEELGEGAFGKVYKGELTTKEKDKIFVAVKALKENASAKTQQDFKREIELISDLHHENIVNILGVILKKEPYCMLFEFMSEGDLHEFLISNSPNEGKSLTQLQFLYIALQICDGMTYLANHHYVHRDLAARNCLVGDNLTVKISDFGLSRDIYSSDYYRVQSKSLLPVRWMPSESILYGKFTTESDVWSYGVVLWEIYSYGLQPYYGYSNQEVINMIRARQLLPCPESCPEYVYNLMKGCWDEQAVRRPAFPEIGHRLKVWYQTQKRMEQSEQSLSSRKGSALSIASKGCERKNSMNFDASNVSVRSSINRSTKSVNTCGITEGLSGGTKRSTTDMGDMMQGAAGGTGGMIFNDASSLHHNNQYQFNGYNGNNEDAVSISNHHQRSYSRNKNQRSHSVNVDNHSIVSGSVASIVSETQSQRHLYPPPSGRSSNSLKKQGCNHHAK